MFSDEFLFKFKVARELSKFVKYEGQYGYLLSDIVVQVIRQTVHLMELDRYRYIPWLYDMGAVENLLAEHTGIHTTVLDKEEYYREFRTFTTFGTIYPRGSNSCTNEVN